jgi:hypothetical protein
MSAKQLRKLTREAKARDPGFWRAINRLTDRQLNALQADMLAQAIAQLRLAPNFASNSDLQRKVANLSYELRTALECCRPPPKAKLRRRALTACEDPAESGTPTTGPYPSATYENALADPAQASQDFLVVPVEPEPGPTAPADLTNVVPLFKPTTVYGIAVKEPEPVRFHSKAFHLGKEI